MSKKILFENIDEPGLNTLPVYERRGGYASLKQALKMAAQLEAGALELSLRDLGAVDIIVTQYARSQNVGSPAIVVIGAIAGLRAPLLSALVPWR